MNNRITYGALIISVIAFALAAYLLVVPAARPLGAIAYNGIICTSGETNCVQSNGMNILVNDSTGTQKFKLTASNGNIDMTGVTVLSSESITPTDGGTITPTKTLVTLTPAGALGFTLGACTTGTRMFLYNSVNASIVVTDTGTAVLAGNQTLTQFDVLSLVCIATNWVQVSAVSAN